MDECLVGWMCAVYDYHTHQCLLMFGLWDWFNPSPPLLLRPLIQNESAEKKMSSHTGSNNVCICVILTFKINVKQFENVLFASFLSVFLFQWSLRGFEKKLIHRPIFDFYSLWWKSKSAASSVLKSTCLSIGSVTLSCRIKFNFDNFPTCDSFLCFHWTMGCILALSRISIRINCHMWN